MTSSPTSVAFDLSDPLLLKCGRTNTSKRLFCDPRSSDTSREIPSLVFSQRVSSLHVLSWK